MKLTIKAALALAATLACVSPALAADAPKCAPLAVWQKMVASNGGSFEKEPLSPFKAAAAKRLYAMIPPASPEPKADQVLEASFADGSAVILFLDHGMSCNRIVMGPQLHKAFDSLKDPNAPKDPNSLSL